ncbi:MAG: hypothetical protein GX957_03700 [Clostridiaceae bacterium]|nr:hypothetical protein [Clostridiaceae bacterium]
MKELVSKITPTKIFPLILILINVCAALMCFKQKDFKKGIYWLMAAGLNVCVTF